MKCIGIGKPRPIARIIFLCAAPMVFSSAIRAQGPGELSGVVTDSAGNPVFGAIVEVVGSPLRVRTNDNGEFRITNLTAGVANIQVRRLGFTAVTQAARVSAGDASSPLRFVLAPVATAVEPVLVQASRVQYSGRLAGYYERLHRHSNGSFIGREQIDRASNKTLSQLLSSTPGVNAGRLRTGGGAVRIRGMKCRPLVWLDGVPLPAGEVDLDAFPVSTLHGIEIYLGATNSPPGYTALDGASSCGTILLWSRGRDTERPEPARRASVDLDELTARHVVYTSDEVDTPAHLVRGELEVIYPPDLVAAKTTGSVVTEFVVSAAGQIEKGSIGIVTASHPLFAEAALKAVASANYTPAIKGGVAVRQLVHQPFSFSLGSESASTGARR
jgi:TonB family protein